MEFYVNHPILFVLAGIVIAVVLAQSVYFLVKAMRRSKQLGMDQEKIKKTIKTAAIFTIAPAVAIVISVLALSKSLGLALPWLRLSVVGSMSYETIAASNALEAMGQSLGIADLTAQQYVNVLLVMTVCIMMGLVLVPIIGKKLQAGLANLGKRDGKWADIFQNSLFIGMIAAFLGYVFSELYMLWTPSARFITETVVENGEEVKQTIAVSATYGLIPVCVMLISALVMVACGLAMRNPKLKWLNDYALPISLVVGMAAAIPITMWLG